MTLLTDREFEQRLEQLTFTIAIETTHYHTFNDHRRSQLQKDLLMNNHALRAQREERERRIIAGRHKPHE